MLYLSLFIFLIQFTNGFATPQTFFKKMLADAGIGIHCPSNNKVYLNPITNDLQQCSQQLGSYNETSCPGGTVCERFPILIPGFQDFCCWNNDPESGEGKKGIVDSRESSLEIKRPIVTVTEQPERRIIDGDEESEWEIDDRTTTRRTKRPRSRKITTTTTTTTTEEPTTKRSSGARRLPKCQNPDDNPLIDFGNKLRDCYFQQCYRGFRCEYNKEIRRFICCGQAAEPVAPAGLPPIPAPKPLIPRRFRPGPGGPPGPFSEGDIDGILPGSAARFECENSNGPNCNNQQKGNVNNRPDSWNDNGCPNNGGPNDMCNGNNRNGPPGFVNNGQGHVNQGQQGNWNGDGPSNQQGQSNWNSDGCGMNGNGCGWQPNTATPTPMLPNSGYNNNQNPPPIHNQNNAGNWNNGEPGHQNANTGNFQGNQKNNWNNGPSNIIDNSNTYKPNGDGPNYPQNQNNNWNQGNGNNMMENDNYNENNGNQQSGNWNNGPSSNFNSMNGEAPSSMNQNSNWNQGNPGPSNQNTMDNYNTNSNVNQNTNWNGNSNNFNKNTNSNQNSNLNNNGNDNNFMENGNYNSNQNSNWNQGSAPRNGDGGYSPQTQGQQNKWQPGPNAVPPGVDLGFGDYDTQNGFNLNRGSEHGMNSFNNAGHGGFGKNVAGGVRTGGPAVAPSPVSFKSYSKGAGSSIHQVKPKVSQDSCALGAEYSIAGSTPRCTPPGSDSCPLSHPRCKMSSSLGHRVCCSA